MAARKAVYEKLKCLLKKPSILYKAQDSSFLFNIFYLSIKYSALNLLTLKNIPIFIFFPRKMHFLHYLFIKKRIIIGEE